MRKILRREKIKSALDKLNPRHLPVEDTKVVISRKEKDNEV